MGAPDLLQGLRHAGFILSVLPSGGLSVMPASKLTHEQRAAIKAHKADIVQAIQGPVQDCDREAIEERAAIMEFDGGLSRIEAERLALSTGKTNLKKPEGGAGDPDLHSWPYTTAMNTAEIDAFIAGVHLFTRHGLDESEAERLADVLVIRDRELDDRRLCLECSHLRRSAGRWRCGQHQRAGWAGADLPGEVVKLLQRCDGFKEAMR